MPLVYEAYIRSCKISTINNVGSILDYTIYYMAGWSKL